MIEGKYTVELFKQGGEGAGIERVLASNDSPPIALGLYDLQARTRRPWRFSPSWMSASRQSRQIRRLRIGCGSSDESLCDPS